MNKTHKKLPEREPRYQINYKDHHITSIKGANFACSKTYYQTSTNTNKECIIVGMTSDIPDSDFLQPFQNQEGIDIVDDELLIQHNPFLLHVIDFWKRLRDESLWTTEYNKPESLNNFIKACDYISCLYDFDNLEKRLPSCIDYVYTDDEIRQQKLEIKELRRMREAEYRRYRTNRHKPTKKRRIDLEVDSFG